MKIPNLNILDENNKILRTISKEVVFPLSSEDEKLIFDAIKYLELSKDDKIAEKYDLRAGMGLAFVQLGVPKRIFVIANKNEDDSFEEHIVINPVIKSASEELVYVGEGEGCLSVNRLTTGIVPRHARINVEYQDIKGNKQTIRVREDIAVAFQHEIDHLNGILFYDRIDKKKPFYNEGEIRLI